MAHQSDWIEYYHGFGLDVWIWNYRGYGRSTGTPHPGDIAKDGEYVRARVGVGVGVGKPTR